MYTIINGILHRDGQPIIAMGQSYYPSFHKYKYPVPPEGDRVGVMREDMRLMKEAGFHFLRVAAIGDVRLEDDQIAVDTPFIDETIREAHRQGLAVSVRLQGYVMNLRGHDDYLMRNEKDEPMRLDWSAFMQSSLFHEGILKDNRDASQALARHYDGMPGVVSYQIYNEPHYPYNGIFDYHPQTLAAYRVWRAEQGLPPEEPPKCRPLPGEPPEPWIQWRLFSMRAMSRFLNDTAAAVKAASPSKETYTCMTSAPAGDHVMSSGINYFDNAPGMDAVGITSYTHQEGADYYAAAYQYNLAECAAALAGKHAWTIEIDARTRMPARKLHEETYTLLAAGHKGIVYYEWRGDYPDEGTPLPDNCGFIYHDGRKAEHCDRSIEMIRFVDQYGGLLAAAEKQRDGVALLCSDYATAYADAWQNDLNGNQAARNALQTYRELRHAGVMPDMMRAEHLAENKLGTRLLLIPYAKETLCADEIQAIDAFAARGGHVYCLLCQGTFGAVVPFGWWDWQTERLNGTTSEFRANLELEDVLARCGVTPHAIISSRHLKAGLLKGDGYRLLVLTNTDPDHRDVTNATVTLKEPCISARFVTPDGETALDGGAALALPPVREGGVLILAD